MFTTTGLFKSVPCPRSENCEALNCIFSHDPAVLGATKGDSNIQDKRSSHDATPARVRVPPVKRRKVEVTGPASSTTVTPQTHRAAAPAAPLVKQITPQTLKRPISPPTSVSNGVQSKPQAVKKEALNPRLLASPPTGHDKRTLYLKYLHDQMKRLNKLVEATDHQDKSELVLNENELITASLDEEKQLAFDNPTVYGNVIKQRIGTYKKMTVDVWIEHVKNKIFAARNATADAKSTRQEKPIVTNLTSSQEVRVLRELKSSKDVLTKLGFVLAPPAADEIEDCRAMVVQASNYEVCDRCKTRFQVYPERRETDGILTTNGPCIYHWGRMRYPKREKTDKVTGSKDPVYICCGELSNAKGCTTSDSHVYKMVEASRMSGVVRFINTPENPNPKLDHKGNHVRAVTFDCEMSYTVYGLELTRLTAVTWPDNGELVDVLVQPKGTILDFNTRFSGIDPDEFKAAVPWSKGMSPLPIKSASNSSAKANLPIVPDPETAREIFCSYITPETPLIGHALENDMNSIRLCHAVIVDTIALFPHPKGLPIRYGLKQLVLTHLGRDIQTGGAAGHDSLEDARATGDLVRVKAGRYWVEMEKKGWRWKEGRLVGPKEEIAVMKKT